MSHYAISTWDKYGITYQFYILNELRAELVGYPYSCFQLWSHVVDVHAEKHMYLINIFLTHLNNLFALQKHYATNLHFNSIQHNYPHLKYQNIYSFCPIIQVLLNGMKRVS